MILPRLLAKSKYRNVEFSAVLAAADHVGLLEHPSSETQKASSTPFLYESGRSPPQSVTAKYFVYRVPAGIYTVELGAIPLPILRTVSAPGGQAVYIGDFPPVVNSIEAHPRGDLPAAQRAVAALLPGGLSLVKAD